MKTIISTQRPHTQWEIDLMSDGLSSSWSLLATFAYDSLSQMTVLSTSKSFKYFRPNRKDCHSRLRWHAECTGPVQWEARSTEDQQVQRLGCLMHLANYWLHSYTQIKNNLALITERKQPFSSCDIGQESPNKCSRKWFGNTLFNDQFSLTKLISAQSKGG